MATSGSVYSGYGLKSRFYVKWTRTGTWNGTNCGSTVDWELYLDNHNYWYNNALKVYSIYINGVSVFSGKTWSNITSLNTQVLLASGTASIPHNNNGTKNFVIKFSGWFYENYNVSAEQTFTLDPIPRASTYGEVVGAVLGSPITVNINSNSDSFTHTLWYSMGDVTWTQIETDITTTNKTAAVTFTPPLTLANQIPDSAHGSLKFMLRTFSGEDIVGSDVFGSKPVKVPDTMIPTVHSITASEGTSGLAAQFACYVQNKSTLTITIAAGGAYSSTIKSYVTTVNGVKYNGKTFTTAVIDKSGPIDISTTVTDSRGHPATKTISVDIVEYSDPSIKSFKVERCTSDGTLDDDGTYVKVTYSYDIAPVNDKNTSVARIQYLNGSTWTNLTSFTAYSGNSTYITTATFSTEESFDFRLYLQDYFVSRTGAIASLGTAFTLINYHPDGKSFAFGKVSQIADTIESAIKWAFDKEVSFEKGFNAYPTINTIGTLDEDTTDIWKTYGNSVHRYTVANLLTDQPSQYGLLVNFTSENEVHQLWLTQGKGSMYHRSGNANGWLATWQEILDSTNVGDHALPNTGGTVTGTTIFSKSTDLSGTAYNAPAVVIGGLSTEAHIEIDPNEIQAKEDATTTAALYLNNDGGVVYAGNSPVLTPQNVNTYLPQKVLYSGTGVFMNASQTVTLSEAISAQRNGVILVWSGYENSAAIDNNWRCQHIPKELISLKSGQYHITTMTTEGFGYVATKKVMISDTTITGVSSNAVSSGTGSSVTYKNNYWVLRYVLGY